MEFENDGRRSDRVGWEGNAQNRVAPSRWYTSDTTLNTARWWPVENEKGEGDGVEVDETS